MWEHHQAESRFRRELVSVQVFYYSMVFSFFSAMLLSDQRWSSCCTLSDGKHDNEVQFLFVPYIIFSLLLQLAPFQNSVPGLHSRHFSPLLRCKQCLPGRPKPDVLRPGIGGMRGSTVIRLRPCMTWVRSTTVRAIVFIARRIQHFLPSSSRVESCIHTLHGVAC